MDAEALRRERAAARALIWTLCGDRDSLDSMLNERQRLEYAADSLGDSDAGNLARRILAETATPI